MMNHAMKVIAAVLIASGLLYYFMRWRSATPVTAGFCGCDGKCSCGGKAGYCGCSKKAGYTALNQIGQHKCVPGNTFPANFQEYYPKGTPRFTADTEVTASGMVIKRPFPGPTPSIWDGAQVYRRALPIGVDFMGGFRRGAGEVIETMTRF